jgi:hypothetical protein
MTMKLTTKRLNQALPLLVAGAVLVPAAHAARAVSAPLAGFDHLQDLTAMAEQHHARASSFAPALSGYSHLQDLTATARQYGASGDSHLQDLTAMGNEYRAQLLRLTATPPGFSHLHDLTALANAAGRLPIAGSVSVRTPASTETGRFDWADAGIGAMSGFAAALALAGTLVFVAHRRPGGPDTRTPPRSASA